eukprot:CAMPEP_0204621156 /NCGR_PEP_ID=MMETSP0717-20131115/6968_1 /ASSEMBLY_ACC=CAM_ASM_000666 /TAXON_ID=230516 /ORGANISM="Chaetoceros curvisetus" /LENGTH=95 /DNA_ID=CAMNT_0051635509 /DNA_START=54 /DNA_END=342 /DNA_ORIENTATION=-
MIYDEPFNGMVVGRFISSTNRTYVYYTLLKAPQLTNQMKGMAVEELTEREEKMKHTGGTGGHDSRDDDRNALGNHDGGAVLIQSEFLLQDFSTNK